MARCRIVIVWSDKMGSGSSSSEEEYDVPRYDRDSNFDEAVDDIIVPWGYSGYVVHRVEISPNLEFEIEFDSFDGRTKAEELLGDFRDSFSEWKVD